MRVSPQTVTPFGAPGTDSRNSMSVGPWRLVRPLGEGQWCQVYQAAPLDAPVSLKADYAIKILRPSQRENRQAIAQLQNEQFVARLVDHPHVSSVLSSHIDRAPFYLVMPFQGGSTLREAVARSGHFSVAEALWITRQVAEGLAALHEKQWAHCDVKPENVQVAANGHATLCDLGLALPFHWKLTHQESLPGTPAYMPPEAFSTAITAFPSPASDVYSLGVMLFEILAGQRPFPQQDAAELVAAHRLLRAPDPRRSRPDIPASVVQLLQRLLSKEPLRRPTGEELIDWLVNAEVDSFDLRGAA